MDLWNVISKFMLSKQCFFLTKGFPPPQNKYSNGTWLMGYISFTVFTHLPKLV